MAKVHGHFTFFLEGAAMVNAMNLFIAAFFLKNAAGTWYPLRGITPLVRSIPLGLVGEAESSSLVQLSALLPERASRGARGFGGRWRRWGFWRFLVAGEVVFPCFSW